MKADFESRKSIGLHGTLVWYDEKLNELDSKSYYRIRAREYARQKRCAICGYVAGKKPSEHFLFDFDLEQMLKDSVYMLSGSNNRYITKWWDGEIHHWTVNDGIWKKENSNEVIKIGNNMSETKNIKIINKKEELCLVS